MPELPAVDSSGGQVETDDFLQLDSDQHLQQSKRAAKSAGRYTLIYFL
jgi:hypothetical protein